MIGLILLVDLPSVDNLLSKLVKLVSVFIGARPMKEKMASFPRSSATKRSLNFPWFNCIKSFHLVVLL